MIHKGQIVHKKHPTKHLIHHYDNDNKSTLSCYSYCKHRRDYYYYYYYYYC